MFKNIDFYIKTRCTLGVRVFFLEQECNLVTVLICMTKLNLALLPKKKCKVHMRAFEIVAHRNVDNWTK